MKIVLTNSSPSFSQTNQGTRVILLWNTKIGIGIYDNQFISSDRSYIPTENLDKYQKISIRFTLASSISKCITAKLSSNLISANIFNPKREIFTINLQTAYFYMNREFKSSHLQLNDSFLDFINFNLDFTKDKNQTLTLPSLDFKIEIDLHEN